MEAVVPVLLAFAVLPYAFGFAQSSSTTTDSIGAGQIYGTETSSNSTTSTPQPSDDANDRNLMGGLVGHYYLVFLALVVGLAALAAIMVVRRKKRLAAMYSRRGALQQDVHGWDSPRPRRRYWQDRWNSTESNREEGFNEHGEAPPPYMPKVRDEEDIQATHGPALPLQALSREQAGLKPPDYAEANALGVQEIGSSPSPSGHQGTQPQTRQL